MLTVLLSLLVGAVAALGMAGTNTQIIGGVLKTVYEDFVAEAVNNKFPLKGLFKFETADYAGQEVVYSAHVSRNTSPMWCGEDSAFADAGAQGYVKVRIGQRKLMARVRMTSESIHDSMKSEGAFKSTRKDEMTRLIDDIARMEEYASTTDGRGVLALIDDATPNGSVSLTVDAPGGITGDDFGNRFIMAGDYLGAINPATGALRAGMSKVASCSADGTTVVLTAVCNAAWADNDYLVKVAASDTTVALDSTYEHAAWGLTALFDDGTYRNNYFEVDRSLYPQYQSYVKASTGAISEDVLYQARDVVEQRLSGEISLMTAHHSVRRLIETLTRSDRRYDGNNLQKPDPGTVAFAGGDLPFGGVPIKAIRTHPLGMLFGIDVKGCGLVRYVSENGKWVDEDGNVLIRVGFGSTARDAFEAWYRKRYQHHSRYPGKAFRLDGITGQTLIKIREAGS